MTQVPDGDGCAWVRLSEGLAAGIHHALNNRTAALGGAAQVLESDMKGEHPLMELLLSEIRRLESTTGLLRLLGPSDGGFEPVQIGDVLEQARGLFEIHHDLRNLRLDIETADGLLPVWSAPVGLLRTVMMMLAAIGDSVSRTSAEMSESAERAISLKVSGDTAMVRIVAEMPDGLTEAELPAIRMEDAAEMARGIYGSLEASEGAGSPQWTLLLLTLPEARRREREGERVEGPIPG